MADYEWLKGRNPELEEVDVDLNEASNIAQNYKPENDDVPPWWNAALLEQWKKEKEDIDKKQQIMTEIENEKDITKSQYEKLRASQKLTDSEVRQLVKYSIKNNNSKLNLSRLTSITEEQVKILSNWNIESLRLDWLTRITDEQVKILSNWNIESLRLDWLTSITEEQVKILSNWNIEILLLGLTSITDEQAEILSSWNIKRLVLFWLTSITDEQVKILSNWNIERLALGLISITDKQAEILSNWNIKKLWLSWLTRMTDKQAEEFAKLEELNIDSSILTPKQKDILKDVIK